MIDGVIAITPRGEEPRSLLKPTAGCSPRDAAGGILAFSREWDPQAISRRRSAREVWQIADGWRKTKKRGSGQLEVTQKPAFCLRDSYDCG